MFRLDSLRNNSTLYPWLKNTRSEKESECPDDFSDARETAHGLAWSGSCRGVDRGRPPRGFRGHDPAAARQARLPRPFVLPLQLGFLAGRVTAHPGRSATPRLPQLFWTAGPADGAGPVGPGPDNWLWPAPLVAIHGTGGGG